MGIIKDSLNKQIRDSEYQNFYQTEGQIVQWDDVKELAKVKFINPNSGAYEYVNNVSVMNSQGGIASSGISTGAKCTLSFTNGNLYSPVIVGINDSYYGNRNNEDQGAYIPNDEVYKVGTTEHLVAANLDWIDKDNTDKTKYNNELGDFTNQDVDKETFNMISRLNHYDKNEVGMTNMKTGATVRERNNGDIDIFTKNNTGIRITAGGIIKLYCQDLEYTDNDGELDDTDRSLVTRERAYQVTSIIESNNDIIHIEDTIETIFAIQNMKHVVSIPRNASQDIDFVLETVLTEGDFNNTQTSSNANAGKLQPFNAKVKSYQNVKAEFMSVPVEKDKQIAAYGNEIKNYRKIFDEVLYKLIDKCIEIENGFVTPCTGYIELVQPAKPSDGKMSAGTGPAIISIKNYELKITVVQEDVDRTTQANIPMYKAKPDVTYTEINDIDPGSINTNNSDDSGSSSGSGSPGSSSPGSPSSDAGSSSSPSDSSDSSSGSGVSSTTKTIVSDVKIENETEEVNVAIPYKDNQTQVTVEKVYYKYSLSQWATKDKEVFCEGNNVKFYFYPVIT